MRKNKGIYILLVVLVIFGISVGYAVINRTLNITGNSEIKQNTWNIYFDNVKVKEGSVTANTPVIDTSTKSTINFNVMLNLPGEFYEFTVDVVNSGTIDAKVDSISKTPTLTESQAKYLNYIVEYENGESIQSKQLVKANKFVRLKVRVEYRTDLTETDLPSTTETLNLGFTVNYVQADDTSISIKDNGVFKITANGSLDDIGTIVTIGDQQFYTIGTDGDNVKLFSDMNISLDEKPIQSLRAGKTAFSSSSYKGTNYSDYKGSIAENYVNKYKSRIEADYGIEVIEARLITYDELISEDIGCNSVSLTCSNAPSFIYSTSYWTGSADNNHPDIVWDVYSTGDFESSYCYGDYDFGVRPVIVLKKSDIVIKVKPIANGSFDDIGTVVTIGDQQFYTVGTKGENVKLLSKYNLHVGNQYDDDNGIVVLANPTGKQSENAIGWFNGYSATNPIIGSTAFSNSGSSYSGSIVEGYVNNYKTILESEYGVDVLEARLITKSELVSKKIGCSDVNYTCSNAPSFIYSTTYWLGSAYDANSVWRVRNGGDFNYRYDYEYYIGVRPVIIISKSLF